MIKMPKRVSPSWPTSIYRAPKAQLTVTPTNSRRTKLQTWTVGGSGPWHIRCLPALNLHAPCAHSTIGAPNGSLPRADNSSNRTINTTSEPSLTSVRSFPVSIQRAKFTPDLVRRPWPDHAPGFDACARFTPRAPGRSGLSPARASGPSTRVRRPCLV